MFGKDICIVKWENVKIGFIDSQASLLKPMNIGHTGLVNITKHNISNPSRSNELLPENQVEVKYSLTLNFVTGKLLKLCTNIFVMIAKHMKLATELYKNKIVSSLSRTSTDHRSDRVFCG